MLGLVVLAEQLLEYSYDDPGWTKFTGTAVARTFVFPALVVYLLVALKILRDRTQRTLEELRPTVLIGDEVYASVVRRTIAPNSRRDALLASTAVIVVVALWAGLRAYLLNAETCLPGFVPIAASIVTVYAFFGWLLLSFVSASIRHARGLRELANSPLDINIFDPSSLLPFGQLSLLHSYSAVGLVLIPVVLYGLPTRGGYLVVFLAMISLMSLFVPLWGVHQQMVDAKKAALTIIHQQLADIQASLLGGPEVDTASIAALGAHTSTLVHLRELVRQSPSWPFRDSATLARAIAASVSPLLYFILYEVIRGYLFPLLGTSG
jgi:hypothetical protein